MICHVAVSPTAEDVFAVGQAISEGGIHHKAYGTVCVLVELLVLGRSLRSGNLGGIGGFPDTGRLAAAEARTDIYLVDGGGSGRGMEVDIVA